MISTFSGPLHCKLFCISQVQGFWWASAGETSASPSHKVGSIDKLNAMDAFQTIFSLGMAQNEYIRFRLEVKPDAEFCGGFNLFGEKFGDYPQNIQMEFYND